jgi:hypothetical protein
MDWTMTDWEETSEKYTRWFNPHYEHKRRF